jgi:preprotein translocase subunit SecG
MTSRGTANVLTRATAILAAGFFITSLFLSWYAGHERKPGSGLGAPSSGGLIEQLGGGQQKQQQPQQQPQQQQPAAPAAPSGPQVPQSK